MGPQPNSCGNRPRSRAICHVGRCFNGATAKQLWKPGTSCRHSSSPCGLQWGHSQTAVETCNPQFGGLLQDVASMGPQPNSCGNPQRHDLGIRLVSRLQWGHSQTAVETIALSRSRAGDLQLQWGHSQTAVETPPACRYRVLADLGLQWGHSQTAVETTRRVSWQSEIPSASMGPQPNSCGNTAPVGGTGNLAVASMGPQPNSCGNLGFDIDQVKEGAASMGPQPNSCGNRHVQGSAVEQPRSASMGPQPNSCGNTT